MFITFRLFGPCLVFSILVSSLGNLPLSTSGRWILDSGGDRFTYAGANWPGHMSAMIPEGLQYQSIEQIVKKVKNLGMNSIRLTYATEMVDDIMERKGVGNLPLKDSLVKALGEIRGNEALIDVLKNNPMFTENTTRLEVFDVVAAECEKQKVVVHLDNHISKAKWCCGTEDGNAWPGDKEFDTAKWKRGWRFMANHTKLWPALGSVGLRNELRSPDSSAKLKADSYKWSDWYDLMRSCATGISNVNPNVLIFLSGLGFDTDLSPLPIGADLGAPGKTFQFSDFAKNKVVLELHNYENKANNCTNMKRGMYAGGWNALSTTDRLVVNTFPVVMTEFGFYQNKTSASTIHATCLKDFLISERAGWMVWVLAGSYLNRKGVLDSDEEWGLLNHDWSDWRSAAVIEDYIRPMVQGTRQKQ